MGMWHHAIHHVVRVLSIRQGSRQREPNHVRLKDALGKPTANYH